MNEAPVDCHRKKRRKGRLQHDNSPNIQAIKFPLK